jgi:flagellar protein FliS
MSYSHSSAAYRDRAVRTASPAQLLVMVYDHVLANLARARVAYEKNLIEQRVEAIGRARDGVFELLATLDSERGGDIARNLGSLYAFVLTELTDTGLRYDDRKTQSVARIIGELRDAFATIATDSARVPAA